MPVWTAGRAPYLVLETLEETHCCLVPQFLHLSRGPVRAPAPGATGTDAHSKGKQAEKQHMARPCEHLRGCAQAGACWVFPRARQLARGLRQHPAPRGGHRGTEKAPWLWPGVHHWTRTVAKETINPGSRTPGRGPCPEDPIWGVAPSRQPLAHRVPAWSHALQVHNPCARPRPRGSHWHVGGPQGHRPERPLLPSVGQSPA